ncbi:hypothetical protein E3O25_11000 [Cryobacterium sp. TMT1-3]|uniref:hypothetical protein n=1 Tax=Cryobacterium TaxID=69578 RepID=UPI00106C535A|nr:MULTISPECIES: hypothetical protein [Cryobacterium]TFC26594.1 hypothetical protein E3O25_11000 [Cryobacterium sp. TMT1-3]
MGELGSIVIDVLPSGMYRARASARDDSGHLHRIGVTADTEDEARAEVNRQGQAMATAVPVRFRLRAGSPTQSSSGCHKHSPVPRWQPVVLGLRIVRDNGPRDFRSEKWGKFW